MNVRNEMYPTAEQLAALARHPRSGPIAMVNLLRFHERAQYPAGTPDADVSGREAYMRYATAMRSIVEGAGGRFLFSGDVDAVSVGVVEEPWHVVGIVEYPSPAAFHEIATSPAVGAIMIHRQAGLAGQLLLMTTEDPTAAIALSRLA